MTDTISWSDAYDSTANAVREVLGIEEDSDKDKENIRIISDISHFLADYPDCLETLNWGRMESDDYIIEEDKEKKEVDVDFKNIANHESFNKSARRRIIDIGTFVFQAVSTGKLGQVETHKIFGPSGLFTGFRMRVDELIAAEKYATAKVTGFALRYLKTPVEFKTDADYQEYKNDALRNATDSVSGVFSSLRAKTEKVVHAEVYPAEL